MEYLKLNDKEEINQFINYITNYPEVVISNKDDGTIRTYNLTTNQVVSIPIELKYDKLIFGKNQTENIVNVSFKDDKIYTYYMDGTYEVNPYKPWFLSHASGKSSSKLLGNQFYSFINYTDSVQYRDILNKYRFDKELWFPRSFEESYMLLNGVTYFKGMKLNEVSILSFDIENLNEKTTPHSDLVVIISNTFRSNTGQITKKLFNIKNFDSSRQMTEAWCDWVSKMNPDIVTGHNIFFHDLRILNLVNPELQLGRDGSSLVFDDHISKFRKDGQQKYEYKNAHIHGREIIDTWMLSIKYDIAREFPSYGLKAIEKHLSLQPKDRIEWDFTKHPVDKTLNDPELWKLFLKYAEADSDSPIKMLDIMLPTLFYFNQSVPKTLQQMCQEATGSQLDSIMIRSYLQDGYSQPKTSSKVPFEGAVSIGIPGIYNYVKKIDVTSLYPSIMLEYDIYDKQKDPNKHLIQILRYFREERIKNKGIAEATGDKYYDDLQNTQKVAINSLYGFLGAGYLLYNFPKGAASVTKHGREIIIKTTEWATGHTLVRGIKKITHEGEDNEEIQYEWILGPKVVEGKGYTLVNGDTDSISYTNGQPFNKEDYVKEIAEINSLLPTHIKFADDGAYERLVVIKAKNYIMLPIDPKKRKKNLTKYGTEYSIKGSASKDQKKEPALREFISAMVDCVIYNKMTEIVNVYHKYVIESQNIIDPSRWATKKTVSKAVLESTRSNEQKILRALQGTNIQEGDKVYLIQCVDGERQKMEKGMPVFLKNNVPKMIKNDVYKRLEEWYPGFEDKEHYLTRVYDTLLILENILDKTQFIDYTIKKNKQKLEELLCL